MTQLENAISVSKESLSQHKSEAIPRRHSKYLVSNDNVNGIST